MFLMWLVYVVVVVSGKDGILRHEWKDKDCRTPSGDKMVYWRTDECALYSNADYGQYFSKLSYSQDNDTFYQDEDCKNDKCVYQWCDFNLRFPHGECKYVQTRFPSIYSFSKGALPVLNESQFYLYMHLQKDCLKPEEFAFIHVMEKYCSMDMQETHSWMYHCVDGELHQKSWDIPDCKDDPKTDVEVGDQCVDQNLHDRFNFLSCKDYS